MSDVEFWKGVEGSYRRLSYVAVAMTAVSVAMYVVG